VQFRNPTLRLSAVLLLFTLIALTFQTAVTPSSAQGTLPVTLGPVIGNPPPGSATAIPATAAAVTATPVTVATLTVTPPPEPTSAEPTIPPLPTLRSDLMGIQVFAGVEVDRWWALVDRAQFMGFKWIKFQVSWKEIEPNAKGEFAPKFKVLADNLVYAGRRGFKMMISVVNAPDWARPEAARGLQDGPPANPQDYADLIAAILDQWDRAYINAIEIWNEPNLAREWTGAPMTPAAYKQYFDIAYQTIRARSADTTVITAGPAPTGDSTLSMDDRRWLQGLYAAGLPINDPNLAIGIHPYAWANTPDARCCPAEKRGWDDQPYFFFLDTVYAYRQIMTANNHANGKLWATEFGWSTFDGLHFQSHIDGPAAMPAGDPWMDRITERQQAEYIIRAFELAQTGELAMFMGPMVLWNMNFSTLPGFVTADQPSRPEAGFSVLDADWNTRQAYLYLQAAPKQ
jgi:hypothetical protein